MSKVEIKKPHYHLFEVTLTNKLTGQTLHWDKAFRASIEEPADTDDVNIFVVTESDCKKFDGKEWDLAMTTGPVVKADKEA